LVSGERGHHSTGSCFSPLFAKACILRVGIKGKEGG
jgi:hypothetical protein